MTTDSPRRILHLTATSDMGGTERMILFLAEATDPARFSTHVASLIGSGELLDRVAPHVAAAEHLRFRGMVDMAGIRRLSGFIRRHRIELVQCYGLRADLVGRWTAKHCGVPVVFSSIRSTDPWRRWYHTALDRATARWVDHFVANSEAGKQATVVREKFPPEKISVVYSGLPERHFPREDAPRVRAELSIADDAFPVISILANLREMKGHADVVRALPAILAQAPRTVFVFAGRDDSGGAIAQSASELGVADAIRFPGYVRDTAPLLATSDIFMLPSHWEGLPVSVLEAMHAGLPIITTRTGGIPELVSHNEDALLIEPGDVTALAESVVGLANDEALRRRLGEAAHQRAQSQFSVRAMTEAMETLYDTWLRAKRA